jgi:hypothetical protein
MLHEVAHILHVALAHLFNLLSEPSIMTSVARPFYARKRRPEGAFQGYIVDSTSLEWARAPCKLTLWLAMPRQTM